VTVATNSIDQSNLPDYEQLVKFLFQPFLSEVTAMAVDCEYTIDRHRIWIRVAVAIADRDSAFGRGGRNIQAIRTVLQATAEAVGQSIHLDVHGNNSGSRQPEADFAPQVPSGDRPPRPVRKSNGGEDQVSNSGNSTEDRPSLPPPRPRRQND
jgi:uncharacterized protein